AGSAGPRAVTRGIRACMRPKPASGCSRCFCVRSPHSPSASRAPSRGCWRSRRCCSRAGRMSAAPIRPGSRAPGASAPARWPSLSEGCPTSSGLKRFSTRCFSMPRMRRQMPFARSRSTWRPHFPTALPARAPVDPRRWTCSCGRATSSAPPLGRSRRWPKTASPRRTPRWRHAPARWARGHRVGLGHHLQIWYAYHRAASRVGQVAAIDCASRIAMFCGGTMAEGWACYATDVMEEIGFLDAFDQLALAHTRLRIAARAAVDVRLHTGHWTLEQAEACYRDDVGMSAEAARTEAVKNSMFPATALMYLVGTTLIHTLRRDLAGTLGFELRSFHDRLLSYGSVPVALASEAMTGAAPRW